MTRLIHAIAAERLFDGDAMRTDHAVVLDGDRIIAVQPTACLPGTMHVCALAAGHILVPGYIDLQVNGGGGVMFNEAPDEAGVRAIVAAHRACGTTSLLPTLISGSREQIEAALAIGPVEGALGVHIEGPFLNPARRGIHPLESIRGLLEADLAMLEAPARIARLVTLAPDCVPSGTIARLRQAGVVVFAGHSAADWQQIAAAEQEGLRGVTHLFNAMTQITARAPGVVGATLTSAALMAGLILDGLHVHAANARLALACLGAERLFLVSDAMATVGSSATTLRVGSTEIRLHDGRLTGPDGTLGGAHLCMAEAVRNAVRLLGASLPDALRMATATPAACLGVTDRGRLTPGACADLLALDGEFRVQQVWVAGRLWSGWPEERFG